MTKLEYSLLTLVFTLAIGWVSTAIAFKHPPKSCPPMNGQNHISMEVNVDGSYRCVYQQSVTGVVLARSEKK